MTAPHARIILAGMIGIAAMTCAADVAPAQVGAWTVTSLHPLGTARSSANSANGARQVGFVRVSVVGSGGVQDSDHASLWSAAADPWVDLHPAGVTSSYAVAIGGGQQVGRTLVGSGTNPHAAVWNGTVASWVDLNPPGAFYSEAFAVGGGQQAGYVFVGTKTHASLWNSTVASWVDLNPPGAQSEALALSDGEQVGWVELSGSGFHASLWRGTAASWVDLRPADSGWSTAYAISGGRQGGCAYLWASSEQHAGVWSGTAASWVDLHPAAAGVTESCVLAMNREWQVGSTGPGNYHYAALWRGTAGSWLSLHALLPARFTQSWATGVSDDGVTVYVTGYGDLATGAREALLWSRPICAGDFNRSGGTDGQDIFDFLTAWFALDPRADFNMLNGITTQDIFDFLAAWFAGC